MKKITLTLLAAVALTLGTSAQSFQKGQLDLNLGLGIGNRYFAGTTGWSNVIPPMGASLEYGVTDKISVGGYLGYTGAKWSFTGTEFTGTGFTTSSYTDTYSWRLYILGVRGAYHFTDLIQNDKVDLYGGVMVGTAIAQSKYSTTSKVTGHTGVESSSAGGFSYNLFLGCRYRFTDHIGVFGEVGYGISYLTAGLNYKF